MASTFKDDPTRNKLFKIFIQNKSFIQEIINFDFFYFQ